MKPLVTKRALYHPMVPSKLYLILYTQWQPIGLCPSGRETICHVLLHSSAWSSAYMAWRQSGLHSSFSKENGSFCAIKRAKKKNRQMKRIEIPCIFTRTWLRRRMINVGRHVVVCLPCRQLNITIGTTERRFIEGRNWW